MTRCIDGKPRFRFSTQMSALVTEVEIFRGVPQSLTEISATVAYSRL
jgi:hypothetical protein